MKLHFLLCYRKNIKTKLCQLNSKVEEQVHKNQINQNYYSVFVDLNKYVFLRTVTKTLKTSSTMKNLPKETSLEHNSLRVRRWTHQLSHFDVTIQFCDGSFEVARFSRIKTWCNNHLRVRRRIRKMRNEKYSTKYTVNSG